MRAASIAVAMLAASGGFAAAGDARVAAFRALCGDHPKNAATAVAALAKADGWDAVTTHDDAHLARLVAQTVDPDESDTIVSYRKTLATGEAFLLDKTYDDGAGTFFNTCGIYDFNAVDVAGRDDLEAWLGKPNPKHVLVAKDVTAIYFDPAPEVGASWRVSLLYNPVDGSMTSLDGFAGVAFVSEVAPQDFKFYLDDQ